MTTWSSYVAYPRWQIWKASELWFRPGLTHRPRWFPYSKWLAASPPPTAFLPAGWNSSRQVLSVLSRSCVLRDSRASPLAPAPPGPMYVSPGLAWSEFPHLLVWFPLDNARVNKEWLQPDVNCHHALKPGFWGWTDLPRVWSLVYFTPVPILWLQGISIMHFSCLTSSMA